jgi:hypothetical protein
MVENPAGPSGHAVSLPMRNNARRKYRLFLIANSIVVILIVVALMANRYAYLGTALYVMTLFLICSSPSLFITSYRGKGSSMLIFLAYYFASFAFQDFSNLIAFKPLAPRPTDGLFTGGEIAILVGAISFIFGYVLSIGLIPIRRTTVLSRDWSPKAIIIIGLVSWAIGSYAIAIIQFGVGDQQSLTSRDLGVFGGFLSLTRVLGPLGTLMLIYSFLTTHKKTVLIMLLGTMVADFALGFLGDSKEIAIRSPLLFLFGYVIIRERLPIVATVVFVVIAGLSFNFFAAYRSELATRHETRTSAYGKIGSKLDKILDTDKSVGERLSEGFDYFASRISLKDSVELIVARTGKDVEFKEGYTLKPLLFAFIPRFILPDKQDASTGRLFNREFHISASLNTYISVSALGELYWNFGWTGTIIGMICIGLLLAWVTRSTLGRTDLILPRFLLLLLTIYLLILRSEAGIAITFTYWARTVVLLFLIHMLIPKKRINIVLPTAPSSVGVRMAAPRTYLSKREVKL